MRLPTASSFLSAYNGDVLALSPAITLRIGGAFVGFFIGASSGRITAQLLKQKPGLRDVLIDGVIGAIAFTVAFEGVLRLPWKHTVSREVGGMIITSTSRRIQHPDLIAYGAAVLLP